MARPSKLTEENVTKIIDAILHGATHTDAAGSAGIAYDTFNNWMMAGAKAKKGELFEFFQKVRQAEGECAVNFTRVIQSAAARGDWKAAEAWLKRRRRAEWGDNIDMTSGGEVIKPPQVIEIIRTYKDNDPA